MEWHDPRNGRLSVLALVLVMVLTKMVKVAVAAAVGAEELSRTNIAPHIHWLRVAQNNTYMSGITSIGM